MPSPRVFDDFATIYLKKNPDNFSGKDSFYTSLRENFYTHPQTTQLRETIDYQFTNPALFLRALTHSSFAHECSVLELDHNEKLEFLGDSILNSIISLELFQRFPLLSEGHLSKLRGSIVNQTHLANFARFIKLENCLLLGKGEIRRKEGEGMPTFLCDAFEALIAAIFLDSQNFETVHLWLMKLFTHYEEQLDSPIFDMEALESFDAKTRLQEITMLRYKTLPQYRILHQTSGHKPVFEIGLYINDCEVARIEQGSKKKAERALALEAIKKKLYENLPSP